MALLEPINAFADVAPGFVWRLQTDAGDATSVPVFGSTDILINMSVWADVESFADFVFRSLHVEVMRRRREWFSQLAEAYTAVEGELAAALTPRLSGRDVALRARLLAATFLTTVRVATQHWIEHPKGRLADVVRTAMAAAAPAES